MNNQQEKLTRIDLRPTLIMGLGGSGLRIAVELKARLEEQFGKNGQYQRAIRFLCFDTANERFRASYPNHPEQSAELEPDREFIRISDVPLHNLVDNRSENPAISAILPEILYSTQIDQGAQQVRRLGRVAWFYHYQSIRTRLEASLSALRSMDAMGSLGLSADGRYELKMRDRQRLRVFICTSICGGTGSGTFIDAAYLVRHLAQNFGINSRGVDVIGIFLLPECFPQIKTTGGGRIRANAYASLLDLEYYNQQALSTEALYKVVMPGNETIEVKNAPYSLAYLVQPSGSQGSIAYDQVPSVLADAMYAMIATAVGEKLDATLDNVRPTLTNYVQGYLAFYSAIGFSQAIYPERWLRERFIHELRREIINRHLTLGDKDDLININDRELSASEAQKWQQNVDIELETILKSDATETTTDTSIDKIRDTLRQLRDEVNYRDDLVNEVQRTYRNARRQFDITIQEQLQVNEAIAYQKSQDKIDNEIRGRLKNSLSLDHNLSWIILLLDSRLRAIEDALEILLSSNASINDLNRVYTQEMSKANDINTFRIIGDAQRRRWARDTLQKIERAFQNAEKALVDKQKIVVYRRLRDYMKDQRAKFREAVEELNSVTTSFSEDTLAKYNELTEVIVEAGRKPEAALKDVAEELINQLRSDHSFRGISQTMDELLDSERLSFVDILDRAHRRQIMQLLTRYCQDRYTEVARTASSINVAEHLLKADEKITQMTDRAEPLMNYERGALHEYPPREIKVIAAKSEEDARALIQKRLGKHSDVNVARTDNPASVSLLVTHHGIPAQFITNIREYQRHYQELLNRPNAIFHLDPERESEPYDPGSAYFFNLQDYESYIACMLAYEWLIYDDIRKRFQLDDGFLRQLRKSAQNGSKTYVSNINDSGDYSSTMSDKIDSFIDFIIDNENTLSYGFLEESDKIQVSPVTDFREVLSILYGGELRGLPGLVIDAFKVYEDEQLPDWRSRSQMIEAFLEKRRYKPNSNNPDDNRMHFAQPERTDAYDLERYLCDILNIKLRHLRRQQYQKRGWKWGYVDREPGDDDIGTYSTTDKPDEQ